MITDYRLPNCSLHTFSSLYAPIVARSDDLEISQIPQQFSLQRIADAATSECVDEAQQVAAFSL